MICFVILLAGFIIVGSSFAAEITDDSDNNGNLCSSDVNLISEDVSSDVTLVSQDVSSDVNLISEDVSNLDSDSGLIASESTITVYNETELKNALSSYDYSVINLGNDIELTDSIAVYRENVTIDGCAHSFIQSPDYVVSDLGIIIWNGDNGKLSNCQIANYDIDSILLLG